MNEQTDILLLKQISEGNQAAFTTLFKRYYKPLVLFAYSFVRNQNVAEDLVQNFFGKLWEKQEYSENISYCKSYFYTSIKNYCQNYIRDQKIITDIPVPEESTESNILNLIMEEEIYNKLTQAIQQLPEKCKKILLMKLQGIENTEIASQLNITEETVRSQIRRGKNILKTRLELSIALLTVLNFL